MELIATSRKLVLGITSRWSIRHKGNSFIAVGQTPVAEIWQGCSTNPFWFAVAAEGVDASALVTAARNETEFGLGGLDNRVVTKVTGVLPTGWYHVALLRGIPQRVGDGPARDYFSLEGEAGWPGDMPSRNGYYRAGTRNVEVPYERESTLFEFIVPLQPVEQLNPDRIEHYRSILRKGHAPTAIALSSYHSKASPHIDVEHFIATNFLIDGHHKVEAAHLEQAEITVLAFISAVLSESKDPLEAHRAIANGELLYPTWWGKDPTPPGLVGPPYLPFPI